MQECDLVKGVEVKGQLFVDFLFTPVKGRQSQLSKLAGHQGMTVTNVKKKSVEKNKSAEKNKSVEKQNKEKSKKQENTNVT